MLRGPVWISSQHARYRRMIDFKKKKLFLLDMDGTIYLGDRLFEGTAEFLKAVRRQGGKYLFVTNNSSRSVDAYIARLQQLGIASERDDFLTSVDALIMFLRNGYEKKLIYAAGTKTFREQLQTAGFHITTECTEAVELLVNGFDTELSFQKLEDACRLLTRGVEWIATNPDWVCPTEWGSVPDCGSVSEMLTRATGRRPRFIGKPEPDMALLSMERYGFTKAETVMIGDRIYTDIACGINAGIDTAFVLSGEGVEADIEKYQLRPTGIYRDISEILTLMQED
ncbi:HAD superfamily hydrolase (TIGR01450 family) [Fusobacterium naviforme]|nr:HAD-IIA family hydrolase [Fusobacterium naviforme]PSL10115.1 HAD superfamily hydrolase (TIGR01450 family) [Fusobacterium naviforme]STO27524.1 UMP phosphatase [Fusobacterium naviforme]